MAYEKRVCVLRQIKKGFSADGGAVSGAIYAERLGETFTLTPRIINLAPVKEGRYALAVWAGGKTFCMELRGGESVKAERFPSIAEGVSVLLCYLRGEAEPVAYGYCGKAPASYQGLLSAFAEELPSEKKRGKSAPAAVARAKEETEEPAPPFCETGNKYDDEAIAADDYFAIADHENADAAACGETKKGTVAGDGDPCPHDDAVHPIEFPRGKLTYYNEISERLEKAFKKFPHDERLKSAFPQSEWVNSDGALLGVIYGEGQPRYLCVAVEKTERDAPKQMQPHAVFVPASPFTEEQGFYVVFQDADTGEYVTVENV